jgi:hypothetical protein
MTEPKRRRLPLTGLGLIGAGGVLGVALGMPGAAQAAAGSQTSSDSRKPSPGSAAASRPGAALPAASRPDPDRPAASRVAPPAAATALLAERLDRTVAAGGLTREEADAILMAAEAGLLNGDLVGGPGGRPGPDLDHQPAR